MTKPRRRRARSSMFSSDLDVGDHRTGARSKEQALAIAEQVDAAENLELKGIQAYSVVGPTQAGWSSGRKSRRTCLGRCINWSGQCCDAGCAAIFVTGGSTGTWQIDTLVADLTELQAGSYVVMDMAYRKEGLDFANSLECSGYGGQRESRYVRDDGRRVQGVFYGSGILSGGAGASRRGLSVGRR